MLTPRVSVKQGEVIKERCRYRSVYAVTSDILETGKSYECGDIVSGEQVLSPGVYLRQGKCMRGEDIVTKGTWLFPGIYVRQGKVIKEGISLPGILSSYYGYTRGKEK